MKASVVDTLKRLLKRHLRPELLIHARALDYYLSGPPEIRLLRHLCQARRASVDVGANIGIYTYFLRRHSSHVYAYEPNPELARLLLETFDDRVTVIAAALSARCGTATLRLPIAGNVEMHGLASLSQDFAEQGEVRSWEVPLRRLDDEAYNGLGFIKIDVEQHEFQVLEGAMETIRRERPNLMVEVTPLLYDRPLPTMFADFKEIGYDRFFLFEGRLVPLAQHNPNIHNRAENAGYGYRFATNVVLTHSRRFGS